MKIPPFRLLFVLSAFAGGFAFLAACQAWEIARLQEANKHVFTLGVRAGFDCASVKGWETADACNNYWYPVLKGAGYIK